MTLYTSRSCGIRAVLLQTNSTKHEQDWDFYSLGCEARPKFKQLQCFGSPKELWEFCYYVNFSRWTWEQRSYNESLWWKAMISFMNDLTLAWNQEKRLLMTYFPSMVHNSREGIGGFGEIRWGTSVRIVRQIGFLSYKEMTLFWRLIDSEKFES